MGPLPFAFSVHHFITSVGAYAGFASILGLAALVLLYFAHARETAGLRDELAEAHARADDLEARLGRLSRGPAGAGGLGAGAAGGGPHPASGATTVGVAPPPPASGTPGPAAAPASGTPGPAAPAMAPAPGAAPARPLAAPATAAAAATALVDRSEQPGAPEAASPGGSGGGADSGPGAPAGTGAPPLTAATKLIPEAAGTASSPQTDDTMMAAPAPAPTATGGNGTSSPVPFPAPAPVPAPARQATIPPRAPARPGTGLPRRSGPPPRLSGPVPGPSRRRQLLAALVALLAVAAVVVILLVLTSAGGSSSSTTSVTHSPGTSARHRTGGGAGAINPANVTVSVLNGTAASGLAHRVALKLTRSGFKQGTVATAGVQTRTSTTVAYLPGHRSAAAAVAAKLGLPRSSVAPIDSATQGVACPPPSPCTADVVVVVGADLSNTQ